MVLIHMYVNAHIAEVWAIFEIFGLEVQIQNPSFISITFGHVFQTPRTEDEEKSLHFVDEVKGRLQHCAKTPEPTKNKKTINRFCASINSTYEPYSKRRYWYTSLPLFHHFSTHRYNIFMSITY